MTRMKHDEKDEKHIRAMNGTSCAFKGLSCDPVEMATYEIKSADARRASLASIVFINGFATIALLAALAMIWRVPLVFPSLGPTAFLLFASPEAPSACPRNTLWGHAIGILCGYGALWLTGLQHAPSAMLEGVNLARVAAAAFSLASTGALMILLDVVHSPAGATTLIISLGIITHPMHLLAIEAAVALIVIQAFVTHRLRGIAYPLWSPRTEM